MRRIALWIVASFAFREVTRCSASGDRGAQWKEKLARYFKGQDGAMPPEKVEAKVKAVEDIVLLRMRKKEQDKAYSMDMEKYMLFLREVVGLEEIRQSRAVLARLRSNPGKYLGYFDGDAGRPSDPEEICRSFKESVEARLICRVATDLPLGPAPPEEGRSLKRSSRKIDLSRESEDEGEESAESKASEAEGPRAFIDRIKGIIRSRHVDNETWVERVEREVDEEALYQYVRSMEDFGEFRDLIHRIEGHWLFGRYFYKDIETGAKDRSKDGRCITFPHDPPWEELEKGRFGKQFQAFVGEERSRIRRALAMQAAIRGSPKAQGYQEIFSDLAIRNRESAIWFLKSELCEERSDIASWYFDVDRIKCMLLSEDADLLHWFSRTPFLARARLDAIVLSQIKAGSGEDPPAQPPPDGGYPRDCVLMKLTRREMPVLSEFLRNNPKLVGASQILMKYYASPLRQHFHLLAGDIRRAVWRHISLGQLRHALASLKSFEEKREFMSHVDLGTLLAFEHKGPEAKRARLIDTVSQVLHGIKSDTKDPLHLEHLLKLFVFKAVDVDSIALRAPSLAPQESAEAATCLNHHKSVYKKMQRELALYTRYFSAFDLRPFMEASGKEGDEVAWLHGVAICAHSLQAAECPSLEGIRDLLTRLTDPGEDGAALRLGGVYRESLCSGLASKMMALLTLRGEFDPLASSFCVALYKDAGRAASTCGGERIGTALARLKDLFGEGLPSYSLGTSLLAIKLLTLDLGIPASETQAIVGASKEPCSLHELTCLGRKAVLNALYRPPYEEEELSAMAKQLEFLNELTEEHVSAIAQTLDALEGLVLVGDEMRASMSNARYGGGGVVLFKKCGHCLRLDAVADGPAKEKREGRLQGACPLCKNKKVSPSRAQASQ